MKNDGDSRIGIEGTYIHHHQCDEPKHGRVTARRDLVRVHNRAEEKAANAGAKVDDHHAKSANLALNVHAVVVLEADSEDQVDEASVCQGGSEHAPELVGLGGDIDKERITGEGFT